MNTVLEVCAGLFLVFGPAAIPLLGWEGAAAPRSSRAPATLAETGLYSDFGAKWVAPDVLPYTPQYPLWTDGATKRRWIRLPVGSSIDASDPDDWRFPTGTRLWKEFSFGRRVETRYLEKRGDGSWLRASYVWNDDESEARLAPESGLRAVAESAPGLPHDVPAVADCKVCHDNGDGVLGFGALQLSADRDPLAPHAEQPQPGSVDLDDLVARGWVRGLAPRLTEAPPRILARTPRERAVLGYLHANCGSCHTHEGLLAPVALRLDARLGCDARERVLSSLVDVPCRFRQADAPEVDRRVRAGEPGLSALLRRMGTREPASQMPPLGTHAVDREALALVEAWIREDLSEPHP